MRIIFNFLKKDKLKIFFMIFIYAMVITFFIASSSILQVQIKSVENFRGNENIIINADKNIEDKGLTVYKEKIDKVLNIKGKDIQLNETNKNILPMFNSELVEGIYPGNNKEIIAERWIVNLFNLKLGDLYNGYKLVGIADNIAANKIRNITAIYTLGNKSTKYSKTYIKVDNIKKLSVIEGKLSGEDLTYNYDLNALLEKRIFGKNDILKISLLNILLISIYYLLINIGFAEKMKNFKVLEQIGIEKKGIFKGICSYMFLLETVVLLIGGMLSILLAFVIKDKLYIFNPDLIGKDISLVLNPKYYIYLLSTLVTIPIVSGLDYLNITRALKNDKVTREKKIKAYKNEKGSILNRISNNYIRYYFASFVVVFALVVLGSEALNYQVGYSKLMNYHNTQMLNEFGNGINFDIYIEPSDLSEKGIVSKDIDKVLDIKDGEGNFVVKNILAAGQVVGRIKINNEVSTDLEKILNEEYKNSLKGAIFKEDGKTYLKTSIYTYKEVNIIEDYPLIKNNNKALLYLPKEFKLKDFSKKLDFSYIENDSNLPNFAYGKKVEGIKHKVVDIAGDTDKLLYTGNFYTKDDLPQVIVNPKTFKAMFGTLNYNSIGLNLEEGVNVEQTITDIEEVLNKYNLNVVNKKEERDYFINSAKIFDTINKSIAILLYALLMYICCKLYLEIYNKVSKELKILRSLGGTNKDIERIFIRQVLKLLLIVNTVIIGMGLATQRLLYLYFLKAEYFVSRFNFDFRSILYIVLINTIIILLILLVKKSKKTMKYN